MPGSELNDFSSVFLRIAPITALLLVSLTVLLYAQRPLYLLLKKTLSDHLPQDRPANILERW
jgi:hypothetical protein